MRANEVTCEVTTNSDLMSHDEEKTTEEDQKLQINLLPEGGEQFFIYPLLL